MVNHTCILLNAKSRGSDGLTSWERIKGRKFNQLLLGFGETVLYKLPSKGPRANPDGNMGTRWLEGVFLGFTDRRTLTPPAPTKASRMQDPSTDDLWKIDGRRTGP